MDDTAVKNALDASPAPRVTDDKLASVIVGETFAHRLAGTLTICVLTLANGFTVVGQSACASPENYREDLGEHYAREDAKRKIWPLEAYLLRERLHVAATFETDAALDGMEMYVGMKALYARSMTRGEYNTFKGWTIPADENPDDLGQIVQYSDGYISWTPQAQFTAAYTSVSANRPAPAVTSFLDRMRNERAELNEKLTKLGAFLDSDAFGKLVPGAAELLVQQHGIMGLYSNVLGQRIALAEIK